MYSLLIFHNGMWRQRWRSASFDEIMVELDERPEYTRIVVNDYGWIVAVRQAREVK